jgi:hypothetical protein
MPSQRHQKVGCPLLAFRHQIGGVSARLPDRDQPRPRRQQAKLGNAHVGSSGDDFAGEHVRLALIAAKACKVERLAFAASKLEASFGKRDFQLRDLDPQFRNLALERMQRVLDFTIDALAFRADDSCRDIEKPLGLDMRRGVGLARGFRLAFALALLPPIFGLAGGALGFAFASALGLIRIPYKLLVGRRVVERRIRLRRFDCRLGLGLLLAGHRALEYCLRLPKAAEPLEICHGGHQFTPVMYATPALERIPHAIGHLRRNAI